MASLVTTSHKAHAINFLWQFSTINLVSEKRKRYEGRETLNRNGRKNPGEKQNVPLDPICIQVGFCFFLLNHHTHVRCSFPCRSRTVRCHLVMGKCFVRRFRRRENVRVDLDKPGW